jgi:ankyrin repeat protein
VDVELIKFLIRNGADVNQSNNDGNTALVFLCNAYDEEENVDLDDGNEDSMKARLQAVLVLIGSGANVNVVAKNGDTPISLAMRSGNDRIVNVLKRARQGRLRDTFRGVGRRSKLVRNTLLNDERLPFGTDIAELIGRKEANPFSFGKRHRKGNCVLKDIAYLRSLK